MKVFIFAAALAVQCILIGGQDLDDCMARTMAATDPENAIAQAVASTVSSTATTVINCASGSGANAEQVSGLAIAFSLAISETRAATEGCVVEAIAKAEDVPKIVGETMKMLVMGGVLSEVDGAYRTMAEAWFAARGNDVKNLVEKWEKKRGDVLGSGGCVDLGKVANGLPSAVELAALIDGVVRTILEAVQCGVNIESSEKECYYENGKYVGLCTKPKQSGYPTRPNCNKDYESCQSSQDLKQCYNKFMECMRALPDV